MDSVPVMPEPAERVVVERSRSLSALDLLATVVFPILVFMVALDSMCRWEWAVPLAGMVLLLMVASWRNIFHRIEHRNGWLDVYTTGGRRVIPLHKVAWSAVLPVPTSFSFVVLVRRRGAWFPSVYWAGAMETSAGSFWPTVRALREIVVAGPEAARRGWGDAAKASEAATDNGRRLSLGERWEPWLCARTARMQRDAMEMRPSLSRDEFTQCFPGEQREADAIWDALGQQIFVDGFLPHPDDDLEAIYHLFNEELEDVLQEALDAVGYRIPTSPTTIVVPPVKTVRDAVQCVAQFRPSLAQ